MPTQGQSSDLNDPLHGFSGLTLFPRTLLTAPNPPQPNGPDDLPHAHNFLKSLSLESPHKLLQQAKAIVGGSSILSNSKVVGNARERRPALGRKRPRFSLKPNSSQPNLNLEPDLDIDKLKDPEEFFKAYEKLENAKREILKQTGGVLMDLNQLNPSKAARPRRPGILGRSVKYKHRYSIDSSSQGSLEENILSPFSHNMGGETINPDVASQETGLAEVELQESDLVGAVGKKENRCSELLNDLLTGEDGELDEDGTIALLQEHLQIKPIDLGKFCLPDLQDVQRIDLKPLGADLPKRKNPLSDIHNLLKGISSRTPKKRKSAESPVPCLASPTPVRSPRAALISLKKHILQSTPSIDPFSAHDLDPLPARNASPIEKQIDDANMENDWGISLKLKSPMLEEHCIADVHTSSPAVDVGEAMHSSDKIVNGYQSRLHSGVDVGSSGLPADVVGSVVDNCMDNKVVSETSSGMPDDGTHFQTDEPIAFNGKVDHVLQEAVGFVQPDLNMENLTAEKLKSTQAELDQTSCDVVEDHAVDGLFKTAVTGLQRVQPALNIEDPTAENLNSTQTELDTGPLGPQHYNEVNSAQPDLYKEDFTVKKMNSTQTAQVQTSHDIIEDHAIDGPSETADAGPQQHNEEVQRSTKEQTTKQCKTVLRPRKKGKCEIDTRRQSLAASGTSWESGVRRSTRIRSRPLEYWKGERFLYGRVHESLTTVIGIKYESPGNADGKPGIKVKSFVSDEYKDLVELAAKF